ncbi:MAG TPA: cytochrome P460 family protein [Polyangia bacterium]|nr:cytochrome P460 family protein [Polyangia bacterium]
MDRKRVSKLGVATGVVAVLATFGARAISAPDKYSLKVPGGLAFADFKGYESWQLVSISQNGKLIAAILGNPTIIKAFRAGIPGNGKPFPDGSRMAKVHWIPKQNESDPGPPTVPSIQHDVDFMVKDSKKYPDGNGWGYAAFEYDAATDTFRPGTTTDKPPQGNDAKCGVACHTKAKDSDFVFTRYARR